MDQPCNATELSMFIGYVNYYHTCHWVAHISLNRWQINPVWQPTSWTDKIQKHLYNAFAYDCKSIACPDHNKWFGIHTNASDFQLGMCIIQEGRPVAYFSCNWQCHSKILPHWKNKYFSSQLLSKNFEVCSLKDIHVFTEHKNLMFDILKMECVLRCIQK